MKIKIETERLFLRQFKESDAEALYAVSNQDHVLKWMPDWRGTVEQMRGWIRRVGSQYAKANNKETIIPLAVVLKEKGELIGLVKIGNKLEVDNEIEIAYFISEQFGNRGYISEAARAMTKWAIETLDINYLIAIVEPDNIYSQKVVEKCGFERMGIRNILNSGEKEVKPFIYYRLYRNLKNHDKSSDTYKSNF